MLALTRLCTVAFALVLGTSLLGGDVRAQGNVTEGLPQSRGGEGGQTGGRPEAGSSAEQQGRAVQIGAGTTNATTTGYSGPAGGGTAASAQNELPDTPKAGLCDAFRNSDAYRPCLQTVLKTTDEGGNP
ncbi:hypothetical protein ACFQU1_09995 [Chelatococcus sp. GCM10030263]|uniref:hypothetical protein n=1 Tax=Chelatococcus sp. GCM10030263 TaxID=3273387 RepID=UPI00361F4CA2